MAFLDKTINFEENLIPKFYKAHSSAYKAGYFLSSWLEKSPYTSYKGPFGAPAQAGPLGPINLLDTS